MGFLAKEKTNPRNVWGKEYDQRAKQQPVPIYSVDGSEFRTGSMNWGGGVERNNGQWRGKV